MEETWTDISFESEPFDPESIGPLVAPTETVGEGGWYELGPEGLQRISD